MVLCLLLELDHICKSFGVDVVLQDVCLSLEEGDRIGLLGRNGAGKSTLLGIITGKLDYDSGSLSIGRGVTLGYLQQNGALDLQNTIESEAASVFHDTLELGRRLEALRLRLSSLPQDDQSRAGLLEEYDRMNTAFEAQDGYQIDVKISTVLNGMGFGNYDRRQPVAELSGGEKTRLAIAKLLLQNPQVLILDEPTNHLDFVTLGWLEEYLRAYRGALIVVSHDRYFLDSVVSDICELERHALTRYKGGYSQFVRQKEERLDYWRKQYERQQEEIAKMEDYVARNLVRASTSGSAKSRIAALERMERIDRPPGELKDCKLRFALDFEPYKDVLIAEEVSVRVGEGESEKLLCQDIGLHIEKGEKVAVIGQNGVGKSSLLRALQGMIPHGGRIKWGTNVKISYFEQENRQLSPQKTVIAELRDRFPRKSETELRTLLGSLLLQGDDIYKQIRDLSGGERAKVAFALIMLERANVLILDEPTNHLDYSTKEVLDEALSSYQGTILMVSHDRYLLNRVPSRIIEMFPDRLQSYAGGYDYYKEHKVSPQEAPQQSEPREQPKQNPYYRSKAQRAAEQRRKSRLLSLEGEVSALEEEIAAMERQLASPELASDYQKLGEHCALLEERRALLGARMDEWLALTEETE